MLRCHACTSGRGGHLCNSPSTLIRMELKVRVAKGAHLWGVETFEFRFLANANRRDQITYLEPHVRHNKTEHCDHRTVDGLHDELREVAIQEPAHAIGTVEFHHLLAHHAVPAGAV